MMMQADSAAPGATGGEGPGRTWHVSQKELPGLAGADRHVRGGAPDGRSALSVSGQSRGPSLGLAANDYGWNDPHTFSPSSGAFGLFDPLAPSPPTMIVSEGIQAACPSAKPMLLPPRWRERA